MPMFPPGRILSLLVVVLAAARAGAADLPAAGAFGGPASSHAWLAVPVVGDMPVAVIHVPPRGSPGELPAGVPDGTVALAGKLTRLPSMLAGWDASVIMAFPPEAAGADRSLRRVLVITATPSPLGNTWKYDSAGRLAALPSLPGEGELAGFVGSAAGPAALLLTEERSRLLVLTGGEWQELPLPEGWTAPGAVTTPLLVAMPDGIGLLALHAAQQGIWKGQIKAGESGSGAVTWKLRRLSIGQGMGGAQGAGIPVGPMVAVRGRLIYPARAPDGALVLWEAREDAAYRLCRLEGVGPGFAFAGLDQVGRALVIWSESTAPEGRAESRLTYQMREVSVETGRVLYAGPWTTGGPMSPSDFRMLALLLLGVMLLIVLFVLRPDASRQPVSLPRGFALAEPGRRVLAAMLDTLPALLIASKVAGIPFSEVAVLGIFNDSTGAAFTLLLYTAGLGFAHATLGEWLFGRSLGKVLTGCEVVVARLVRSAADGTITPEVRRLTLWRAALRNAVRWFLPPVALAGLNVPDRRHRGDILAGTVVVVRVEEEEPAAPEE